MTAIPVGRGGLEVHARNEGLVAADDDHDQQVGDHHHVDQAKHDQHDRCLGQLARIRAIADRLDDMRRRLLIPERSADEIDEFNPEMDDIHTLRDDQAEVERQLEPAAHEDEVGQGTEAAVVQIFQGHISDSFVIRGGNYSEAR